MEACACGSVHQLDTLTLKDILPGPAMIAHRMRPWDFTHDTAQLYYILEVVVYLPHHEVALLSLLCNGHGDLGQPQSRLERSEGELCIELPSVHDAFLYVGQQRRYANHFLPVRIPTDKAEEELQ